ncbi:MAG: sensor histidine kinase [Cytophagales bacterium]|nr:sensor histidine kinase [Cytophagales bacterium]
MTVLGLLIFAATFLQGIVDQPTSNADTIYATGDQYYYQGNYLTAAKYYLLAYERFLEDENSIGQSKSLNDAGFSYMQVGKLDSSLFYFLRAYDLDQVTNDTTKMASRLINIGNTYKALGKSIEGVESFLVAAKLASVVSAHKIEARAYNGMGNLFIDQQEPRKALINYWKAYDLHTEHNHTEISKAIALGNIGSAYFELGILDSAFSYTHKALKIKQESKRPLSLAHTLEELGRFQLEASNLDSADHYLSASLKLRTEGADQQGVASVSLLQARYMLEIRKYSKVMPKLNIALGYARQYEDRELLLECYDILVDYHRSIQNWESAFRFKTNWATLRDSLFNAEKLQVQQIISEQQLQEKEQERLLADQQARIAEAESQQQQQNARNTQIIASVLAIFLLSSGVGMFIINRQRRKVRGLNVELQQRNEKVKILGEQSMHFTKNALSEITALLNFQSGKLEGVAKDLMQGARLRLDTINILYNRLFANKDQEENQVDLGYLISSILGNTLDALLEEKFKPQREFDIQSVMVSSEVALSMGLITNELCINACKYAFTQPNKRLTVRLNSTEDRLYFLFEENGPGLPPELNWESAKSFGLQLITLLADDLNADLNMENCSPGLKIELTIANH